MTLNIWYGAFDTEPTNKIYICFRDITYPTDWSEEASDAYKLGLIKQFGIDELYDVDIFPGASMPGFLQALAITGSLYIAGANMIEAPATYTEFSDQIFKYLAYNEAEIIVSKNGAMMLAFDAVTKHLTNQPISLTITAYEYVDNRLSQADYTIYLNSISDAPPMELLLAVDHMFNVIADDRRFRVVVREATVIYLVEIE